RRESQGIVQRARNLRMPAIRAGRKIEPLNTRIAADWVVPIRRNE
ncbi:unnamed protein product, partial [marine sediment metagenome]